jgi:hypothetical protein
MRTVYVRKGMEGMEGMERKGRFSRWPKPARAGCQQV